MTENRGHSSCSLCGLPLGRSDIAQSFPGDRVLSFCCPGCLYVFQILFNRPGGLLADYKETGLYQACVAAGLIPSGKAEETGLDALPADAGYPGKIPPNIQTGAGPARHNALERTGSPPPGGRGWGRGRNRIGTLPQPLPSREGRLSAVSPDDEGQRGFEIFPGAPPALFSPQPPEPVDEALTQELSVRIEGMWCVACSWLIEQILRKLDGVLEAPVFFLSDVARIKYLPHLLSPQAIYEAISKLGYRAVPLDGAGEGRESAGLLLRLGISAVLTFNIMMISFALYAGFFEEIGTDAVRLFSYPLWVLATPVVFYGGFPILKRALLGAAHFSVSMDTLIGVGVLSAYFYSLVQMGSASLHVYFDTSAMLVTLVLLGRFIEVRAKEKISAGMTALFRTAGAKVRLRQGGRDVWTSAGRVRAGDRFVVFAGERVGVDGRIVSGKALLDQSVLTGEAQPAAKGPGDEVLSGALVLDGPLECDAVRPGSESSLNQVIAMIREALASKGKVELFADRVMRLLVPGVLLLAAATALALVLSSVPAHEAVLRGVTVLVVTCPCALGIAAPLARVAAIGAARSLGILVRNPEALEKGAQIDAFVFDKTGTITEGRFSLREIATADGSAFETGLEALRRVASAELKSGHFLARAIVAKAHDEGIELDHAAEAEELEGLGIRGRTRSGKIVAGNRRLMELEGFPPAPDMDARARSRESDGMTTVFFAWDGAVRGFFAFGDRVKPGAAEAVSALLRQDIQVWIVSGDSKETTRAVAQELGVERYAGQALPADKAEFVKGLRAQGLTAGMAGDGINDAAALAHADLGITIGSGANLIREASDAAIFGDDPAKIPVLLDLSRFTSRVIRQNLFFAFFYNLLGIPLAVSGLLNPLLAATAMFASSATVVANTLRISRFPSR